MLFSMKSIFNTNEVEFIYSFIHSSFIMRCYKYIIDDVSFIQVKVYCVMSGLAKLDYAVYAKVW